MASDGYREAFDGILETYLSLDESAGPIIRQLKKTPNTELRIKLVREMRSLEKKRLELLDQMDDLAKPT
jgi:hypothetical protein